MICKPCREGTHDQCAAILHLEPVCMSLRHGDPDHVCQPRLLDAGTWCACQHRAGDANLGTAAQTQSPGPAAGWCAPSP